METGSRNEPGYFGDSPPGRMSFPGPFTKNPGSWRKKAGTVRQYPVGFGFFRPIAVNERGLPNSDAMLTRRDRRQDDMRRAG